MDVLIDKEVESFEYTSRYAGIYFYYHTLDNKYIRGLTKQLKNTTSYVLHNVKETDDLDYLANYYYGRPDYFWIIADFNHIQDPFIKLSDYYDTLKIPTMSDLVYKEG